MISLVLRNLFFTILQPGVVGGLIPYLLVRGDQTVLFSGWWTIWQYAGALITVSGFFIILVCIVRFATEGKGTLSPLDPTKKLVAGGLYKYSRNPMYVGMILLLTGETLIFQSFVLAGYTILVFIAFNLFIMLHEEPRLRRDFGNEYGEYCQKVRRWL